MPFGPGETILRSVEVRHLYCINSASVEFGLNKDRVRALMEEQFSGFQPGLPDAQTYFDAAVARPILEAASETLTSTETRKVLGIKEERMRDLLDAGIVEQVETRTGDERAFARIPKSAFHDLLRQIAERMTMVESDDGLMTLAAAARSWRRPFHNIVARILDGSLEAFCISGDEPILRRVRVKSNALMLDVSPTAGGDESWMRLKEVEQALGTTTATVNELIERGYLRIQKFRRETGRTIKPVERHSVSEFQATYLSLSNIAKSTTGYRAQIKADLEKLNVKPIFEPEGFIARFYK